MNVTKMVINTKAISRMVRRMARESTLGQTENFTTASGRLESKKAMAFGRASAETPILENGKIQKRMDMVCINGKMVIGMKESGICALSMVKGQTSLQMEIHIQASTNLENLMVKVSTNGKTEVSMSVSSKKD